jgi:hypothetical protein
VVAKICILSNERDTLRMICGQSFGENVCTSGRTGSLEEMDTFSGPINIIRVIK